MPDVSSLLDLLTRYGYVLVFAGVLLESAGVPVPGESILIAAGVLAERGTISLVPTMAIGAAGAIVGDQLGYLIGRSGGRSFLLRWGRYVAITPDRIMRSERFFARHGGAAVFLARFVPGLRVFGALMAGVGRMHWATFAVFNALGGIIWASAAVLGGYVAGSSYHALERWIGPVGGIVAGVVAVALLAWWLVRHRRSGTTAPDATHPARNP
ncbi:MAG: phosphoesterase, PA-phosphatase related [Thermoleophilia bacterium]|nr:phosphoesterase, PA-phosphatase related [Thermoleophilia bacterium]